MAAEPNPIVTIGGGSVHPGSNELVSKASSNELFFAVVGHAGSGTSEIASALQDVIRDTKILNQNVDVSVLKARTVIEEWAGTRGLPLPSPGAKRRLADVSRLQDYGDDMRAELRNGQPDFAAVAKGLVKEIRKVRAFKVGATLEGKGAINPDGKPRAYILDSIRHPDEVRLLRHLYGDAFVLIGVVCEERQRVQRMLKKYEPATEEDVRAFMKRDADAGINHGQHVADAFHLSDFFVDNTANRTEQSVHWDVNDKLGRLMTIISHSDVERPRPEETAMYHAYSAQMQSACLSRQVGAALVDANGNLIGTGTNEAPRAGGGVYGESVDRASDFRCAKFPNSNDRFCRNTRTQNEIIQELIEDVPELRALSPDRKNRLAVELRRTQIGGLVEFSRAVHAEMDALLSAARKGTTLIGTRLFVTAFPCHFCARHIVTAGVDEVQYIEPYPKSRALALHKDAITVEALSEWKPPSKGGDTVLFRPFSGVSPRLYERAFLKERELKDKNTGIMKIQAPQWGTPWRLSRAGYPELEAALSEEDTL